MCRFLSLVSNVPSTIPSLLTNSNDFFRLSEIHSDGCGIAWYNNNTIYSEKVPEPAYKSDIFKGIFQGKSADTWLVHFRKADPGMPNKSVNCHPFIHQRMDIAFMHNGLILHKEELRKYLHPNVRELIQGTTDSEIFFWYIVTTAMNEQSDDWGTILVKALKSLHTMVDYSSLNCCLATPEKVYIVCDYNPHSKQAINNPDYYEIYFLVGREYVFASSSGWEFPEEVIQLGNKSVLTIERRSLRASVSHV